MFLRIRVWCCFNTLFFLHILAVKIRKQWNVFGLIAWWILHCTSCEINDSFILKDHLLAAVTCWILIHLGLSSIMLPDLFEAFAVSGPKFVHHSIFCRRQWPEEKVTGFRVSNSFTKAGVIGGARARIKISQLTSWATRRIIMQAFNHFSLFFFFKIYII